jgi:hypothetical protein
MTVPQSSLADHEGPKESQEKGQISIDYSVFCQPHFSPVDWINSIIDNKSSTETQALELLTRLQLFSTDLLNDIEKESNELVQNAPKAVLELEQASQDMVKLKQKIEKLKQDMISTDGNTSDTIQELAHLDLVKSRMESSRLMLKETENWTNLPTEISLLLSEGSYENACQRLCDAKKSLQLFKGMPEFDDRSTLLERLQNEVKEALLPLLSSSLTAQQLEQSEIFYRCFDKIEKGVVFFEVYFRCRAEPFQIMWKELCDSTLSQKTHFDATIDRQFQKLCSTFLDELYLMIEREVQWGELVFIHPVDISYKIMEKVFLSLNPSLVNVIRIYMQEFHDSALPHITGLFSIILEFSQRIEKLLILNPVSKSINTQLLRRSIDTNITRAHFLFEPFENAFVKYQELETRFLLNCLKHSLTLQSRSFENLDSLRTGIEDSFQIAQTAIRRCIFFTHGYGSCGLVEALNTFFDSVSRKFITLINMLEKRFHSEAELIEGEDETAGFSSLVQFESFTLFQLGFKFLDFAMALTEKLDNLQVQMSTELEKSFSFTRDIETLVLQRGSEGISLLKFVEHALDSLSLTSFSFLWTSKLNSAELLQLRNLIDQQPSAALRPSRDCIERFTSTCQAFIIDTLYYPVRKELSRMKEASMWDSTEEQKGDALTDIPVFSLSPSSFAQQIGDHFLTLPQQVEPFADQPSFRFSITTLPLIDECHVQVEGDTVVHIWVACIAHKAMHSYVSSILSLPAISESGVKQIIADMEYLTNIFSALEVEPNTQFSELFRVLDLSANDLNQEVLAITSDPSRRQRSGTFHTDILTKLAQIRRGAGK